MNVYRHTLKSNSVKFKIKNKMSKKNMLVLFTVVATGVAIYSTATLMKTKNKVRKYITDATDKNNVPVSLLPEGWKKPIEKK